MYLKYMIIVLMLICGQVFGADIYVDADATGLNSGKSARDAFLALPHINGHLIAKDGDVFLLAYSAKSYKGVVINADNITIRKYGDDKDNPVIIPRETTGSTFCVIQRGNNLTFENVTIDASMSDSQASHFGIRTEGDVKGITVINGKMLSPPAEIFEKNRTTRKQMNFEFITADKEISIDMVEFVNEQDVNWLTDKASQDSTIVIKDKTSSVSAEVSND